MEPRCEEELDARWRASTFPGTEKHVSRGTYGGGRLPPERLDCRNRWGVADGDPRGQGYKNHSWAGQGRAGMGDVLLSGGQKAESCGLKPHLTFNQAVRVVPALSHPPGSDPSVKSCCDRSFDGEDG